MQDSHSKPLQSTVSRSTLAGNVGRKVPARVVLKGIRRIWCKGRGGVAETARGVRRGLIPSDLPVSTKKSLTRGGKWVARGVRVLATLLVTWALPVQGVTTQPVFQTHSRNPTADKPQSKLWFAHDQWWALLPTGTGPSLWQRAPAGWSEQTSIREALAGLPGRGDVWFDQDGATVATVEGARLAVLRLTCDGKAPLTWRPAVLAQWTVPTDFPLETATIARDGRGEWWVAAAVTPAGGASVKPKAGGKATKPRAVQVWHSPDARTWTALPPLATGIGGDDICLVMAIEGGVGVAWSDQNRDEVRFRLHRDGRAPADWAPAELVASGGLTADDHLNAACAGGRLWLATKNSVDTAGQPQLVLRVRSADGTWQNLPYAEKTAARTPSRPIVVATPDGRSLLLGQTDYAGKGTPQDAIAFGAIEIEAKAVAPAMTTVIGPDPALRARVNDVTGPKAAFPASGPWIVLASDAAGRVYEADVRPLAGPAALPTGVPYAEVSPRIVTEPARWDTDDPAFWFHPTDPTKSLVIGTDKHHDGALLAYALDGRIVGRTERLRRPNNVDVIQGFPLGGGTVDLAITTERETMRLRAFALPSLVSVDAGDLTVFKGDPQRAPMGVALYRRPRDGAVFAIVSGKSGPADGYLAQYRLEDDGTGRLKMTLVREFGRYSGKKEIESIAVDAGLGYVYYSDETCGVRKYHADPDAPGANEELALFATEGFASDHEGISIYRADARTGYLLVSDQQADRFWIYPREGAPGKPHEHKPIKIVKVAAHESDGSDVTARFLGPRFPAGMFAVMSTDRTFHFYAWEDIAGDELRVLPVGRPSVAAPGETSFRFTVTSDPHQQPANYDQVLAAMQRHSGGQGSFQIAVGDLSDKPGHTPQVLRDRIDARFGRDARWLGVMGNHDAEVAAKSAGMTWWREEFAAGRDGRAPLRAMAGLRPGPRGCEETTYSWDEGNAHFVVLNLYWNGGTAPGDDATGEGDVVPALLTWLEQDLAANTKPFVFVFGHEPAFPQYRHVGDSLDLHPANRDAFWQLLSRHRVQAYFCGHVHRYFKERRDGVWQVCDGHAGRVKGGDRIYLDVSVGPTEAEIKTWIAASGDWSDWTLLDTIRVKATVEEPATK